MYQRLEQTGCTRGWSKRDVPEVGANGMEFGGDYIYVPNRSNKEDYELVPENRYTHRVSGATNYQDDGEVNLWAIAELKIELASINNDSIKSNFELVTFPFDIDLSVGHL